MTAHRPVRDLLRRSLLAALVAGGVCSLAGLILRGGPGLLGGLLATGMVAGFLVVGQVPLARSPHTRSCLVAAALLVLYVVRVLLLIAAYAVVVNAVADEVDRELLGVTVIVTALAWTAATVHTALRWRPTLIEPED